MNGKFPIKAAQCRKMEGGKCAAENVKVKSGRWRMETRDPKGSDADTDTHPFGIVRMMTMNESSTRHRHAPIPFPIFTSAPSPPFGKPPRKTAYVPLSLVEALVFAVPPQRMRNCPPSTPFSDQAKMTSGIGLSPSTFGEKENPAPMAEIFFGQSLLIELWGCVIDLSWLVFIVASMIP